MSAESTGAARCVKPPQGCDAAHGARKCRAATRAGRAAIFANSGEADIRGAELSGTWRPAAQTWVNLTHTELRIAGLDTVSGAAIAALPKAERRAYGRL